MKKNVIVISMDCCRADHVGCYGYARNSTPNIDRLAKKSILFKNCFVQSSYTLPSHTTMFTGLNPSAHGACVTFSRPLPNSVPTLMGSLRQAGYKNVAWVGGPQLDSIWGLDNDFDAYYMDESSLIKNIDRATEWVGANKERNTTSPFFLFIHGMDIHYPFYPEGEFATSKSSRDRKKLINSIRSKLPMWDHKVPSKKRLEKLVAYYDNAINNVDRAIGKLVSTLEDNGLDKETIVLITSDHGEELGERGFIFKHGHNLYDEVLRVPFVLHVPGLSPREVSANVRSLDFTPTLLEALGLPIPKMQGESLLSYCRGDVDKDRLIFSELNYPWMEMFALRSGYRKVIMTYKNGKKIKHEMYNVLRNSAEKNVRSPSKSLFARVKGMLRADVSKSDPIGSLKNMYQSSKKGSFVPRLPALLHEQREDNKRWFSKYHTGGKVDVNEELKQQLAELGYL